MTRHIFRQIWNCRRSNLWLWALLFVVTVLMWYAVDIVYNYESASRRPMGYDYDGTYQVDLRFKGSGKHGYEEALSETRAIIGLMNDYPGVQSVGWYRGSYAFDQRRMFEGYCTHDDSSRIVSTMVRFVSPDYFETFGMKPLYGSVGSDVWLPQDYPLPVAVTEDLADSLFTDASTAVGQTFFNPYYWRAGMATNYRVAAVMPRQKFDEYARYEPMIYLPYRDSDINMLTTFSLKVSPDARTGFEERFADDMRRRLETDDFYFYGIQSYDALRDAWNISIGTVNYLNITYGVICFFLFTVFLTVFGAFSIRTRRRRAEIGLKMAMGCSRRRIMSELLLEGIIMLLLPALPALLAAVAVAREELVVDTLTDMSAERFALCFAVAILALGSVIAVAILPSAYSAMTISPSEALHDE